jgi:hypothetical protein
MIMPKSVENEAKAATSAFALPGMALLMAAFLLGGCAGAPPNKTIQIDSDPQGVRVECNNEDLGKTPTTFSVRTNPEGEFLGAWAGGPMVEFVVSTSFALAARWSSSPIS